MTWLWLLIACGDKEKEAVQCAEDAECGFGEVCIEGACSGQVCATSAQCGMEEYCKSGSCVSGCEDDDDCYPGQSCDTTLGTCGTATCTDSRVDCAFGEFCNSANGECYEAGGYYCSACNDDDDCGGNGNLCLNLGYVVNFCGVTCSVESDCPNGYTCAGVSDSSGNIVSYQCLTYCWLYGDDDDSARRAPLSATHVERRP